MMSQTQGFRTSNVDDYDPNAQNYRTPPSIPPQVPMGPEQMKMLVRPSVDNKSRILDPVNAIKRKVHAFAHFYPSEVDSDTVVWRFNDDSALQARVSAQVGGERTGDLSRVVVKNATLVSCNNDTFSTVILGLSFSRGNVYGNGEDEQQGYKRGCHVMYSKKPKCYEGRRRKIHLFRPSVINADLLERYGKLSQAAIESKMTWIDALTPDGKIERKVLLARGHPVRTAWERNYDRLAVGKGYSFDPNTDLLTVNEQLYEAMHEGILTKLNGLEVQNLENLCVEFRRPEGLKWNDDRVIPSRKRPQNSFDNDEQFTSEVLNSLALAECVIELEYYIIDLDTN